ncbi:MULTISPECIES: type II toxin-antitoxin system VapC family toxin [Thermoanaerobacterium]|uniref:PilT protein domain-containing protein n=2 Tax=Thermoanaerobacterium TaxID=28895 RepID=W9E9I8_9THEO|nr:MULTISPECIES: PIN domain-containing protein [Thermoanaerobacterium]AFK85094.1 PilT protein domain protein [Thermoanaerobacterium saccharolyticum JW/SL-YS485]ETO37520.1 PilT protein domain-containing protein [Thermoanaerobacterium aotearoense SCUT27]
MKDKILIDTSAWIEYFRNKREIVEIIDDMLLHDRAYITGFIIAELFQGVKTEKERAMLERYIDSIPTVSCDDKDWIRVGKLSFKLRRDGKTIPLSDVLIAYLAIKNDMMIFSFDQHFKMIDGVKLFDHTAI